jgi:prepilin-type N-terminal cleavage/methylation domain-containing protein
MEFSMAALSRLRSERGFTLIEVMVTMLLLVVGIAATLALIDGANARTLATKQREAGNALTREVIEAARSVPYRQLNPTSAKTTIQAIPGLEDTTPLTGAWTVERRKTVYTVSLSVCSIDDDQDGLGDITGGNYCGGGGGTADRNPDDYKRATVNISWKSGNVTKSIQQAGIVNNEASSAGPAVEIVSQTPGGIGAAGAEITSHVSQIKFGVEADPDAVAIRFAVDGVLQGTANGASATFDWDIDSGGHHVPDGTYIVSVTALDQEGVPGPTRSRTIRLNRDIPSAPQDVFGGFNPRIGFTDVNDIVELQWARNTEPDVTGYRVYREAGATDVLVCDYSTDPTQKECRDMSPPAGATIDYYVVAVDENPITGGAREGDHSGLLTAFRASTQPNQPASLTATQDGEDVVLTWPDAAPMVPPYSGSDVIFYRVYRNGIAIGDRIARTGQESLTAYRDSGEAAGGHEYYVTAVDENFSESKPLGPVSVP